MIIDGLIIAGAVALGALGIWGTSLLLRREDARAVDADVHVMRLKYGNTWGAQRIRAQLIAVGKLIEIADQQVPWPPAQPPAVTLHGALHHQLPIAPDSGRAARAAHASAAHGTPARAITSPAGNIRMKLARVAGPGTAAAAAAPPSVANLPAIAPPPLPDHVAACPEQHPFTEWLRDDVAEAAIQDAAYAQLMASYHKPLDGAS